MSNVVVMGMPLQAGGLKESLAKMVRQHREDTDAILNVSGIGTPDGKPVDKDELRAPYVHTEWPKMMYRDDYSDVVVFDEEEVKAAKAKRFQFQPFMRPQIAVHDPATEKKALVDTIDQLKANINQKDDLVLRMQERLEKLEALASAESRPKGK